MIAVDSSSFIAFIKEDVGQDVQWIADALNNEKLLLPPVVLAEVLSNHRLPKHWVEYIEELPLLSCSEGFWSRAGILRAHLLAKKLKARLADTLIAQSCIDHSVPLITRDSNFRHYVKHGLVLFDE